MPRPVCVKCRREMQLEKPVEVMFNAYAVGGNYQAFQGDLARCPECGVEVVVRWAEKPFWARHKGPYEGRTPDVTVEEVPFV